MLPVEPENWPDDAIEVGAIVDAYGLKGWVKIAPHAQAQSGGHALLSAKRWWLAKGPDRWSAACVAVREHGESLVAQVDGVANRDAALQFRGARIHVSRDEFPALDEDEFYWVDLIGLDVVNEAGESFGQVAGMIDNGAHSVLRVAYPVPTANTKTNGAGTQGKPATTTGERLIPFVDAYVKTVDQAAKRIVVDWQIDY